MDVDDESFLRRLRATFRAEATEHVRALSASLVALEQAGDGSARQALIEEVFRQMHSLKGAARAVDRTEIESVCRFGESLFDALKRGVVALTPARLDVLHDAVGVLDRMLHGLDDDATPADRAAAADVQRRLDGAASSEPQPPATSGEPAAPAHPTATPAEAAARDEPPAAAGQPPAPVEPPAPAGPAASLEPPPERADLDRAIALDVTVRVPASRLDGVLFTAEALLASKLGIQQREHDLREAKAALALQRRERERLAPDLRRLHKALAGTPEGAGAVDGATRPLRRLLDHLAADDAFQRSFEARLGSLVHGAVHGARGLGGQVEALLEQVKQLLMLPVGSLTEALPRLVRDLARAQGKEVDFRASGVEVEIDRRVLDAMREPLIHLVRNAVDHGVEPPDARVAAGKPRRATLRLLVRQVETGRFEMRLSDDGAGIDEAKLRASARRLGLPDAAGDGSALPLAFRSGVSTSPLITDISGRGLGLAIVREKAERLGGTVGVTSRPGEGTTFRLLLPMSLATFRGVRVRAAGDEFILPTIGLERVLRVPRDAVSTLEQRDTLRIDDRAVALVRLAHVLELADASAELPPMVTAVVTGRGERRLALAVDEVVGEQEVLVKGLGRQLRRVRNVAGATVLGNGRVVPVLYLPDLFASARRLAAAPARGPGADADAARRPRSILVAEDSVTARTLLKGILESAGFRVETAVDGADALARLRSEAFDLLVSDVEMPRMDGFQLTASVRADPRLAALPVVLVTALGGPDDRRRGADAGANAYIVKTRFDQSNLLSVIRRLL